ncbi:hypothetical protein LARV_01826 [Longilinea arvoryzae]|uniref:Uncharacterized protein n=1 Tax=Longilinea arvoryzae TaxID=360412 RepID=A0A0S7BG49_9CHLR|nr:hypothetical protein [Longilinea arvoryzae]GAP14064.1 hypothetical protein LARV_01826 [Longilinea arvoryzae]
MRKALFEGLVVDENGNLVTTGYVGDEPCYIVNDSGFLRHVPSEQVDRQVLQMMGEQIEGHEDEISEQTAKMLGQEDIFTRAMLLNQIKQMDKQFESLLQTGIPEDARAYMGMMGFKIVIDMHGEIVRVDQPSAPSDEGE